MCLQPWLFTQSSASSPQGFSLMLETVLHIFFVLSNLLSSKGKAWRCFLTERRRDSIPPVVVDNSLLLDIANGETLFQRLVRTTTTGIKGNEILERATTIRSFHGQRGVAIIGAFNG
jgi:hypothetical protein